MVNDAIHAAVKRALINDGWSILSEHFRMQLGRYKLFADLAAERTLAAERNGRKILIEIKSFSGRSYIKELQQALGQYRMYLDAVELTKLGYDVYLAVGREVYDEFLSHPEIEHLLQRNQVRLVIIHLEQAKVTKWIN
ncbi:MAG: element excision factor XisH family protein [Caldilineaceae bacterium]